jgi:hypothetical protein
MGTVSRIAVVLLALAGCGRPPPRPGSAPASGPIQAALPRGCAAIGGYRVGEPAELEQITARLRRSCDAGSTRGCSCLGLFYDLGRGVPRDLVRAVALHRQACERGDLLGCNNLGIMHLKGRGLPRDHERALALFQRACDGGDLEACSRPPAPSSGSWSSTGPGCGRT